MNGMIAMEISLSFRIAQDSLTEYPKLRQVTHLYRYSPHEITRAVIEDARMQVDKGFDKIRSEAKACAGSVTHQIWRCEYLDSRLLCV